MLWRTQALALVGLVNLSSSVASRERAGYGQVAKRNTPSSELLELRGQGVTSIGQHNYNSSLVSDLAREVIRDFAPTCACCFLCSVGLIAAQLPPRRRPGPGKPDECPPCFNCLLPAFNCGNGGVCNEFDGQCRCPAGFGGEDCTTPRKRLLAIRLKLYR